jgi:putative intracellular protease/amidase
MDGLEMGAGIALRKIGDLQGSDYDVVLIADGAGADRMHADRGALRVVKEAFDAKKILAAIGAGSLVIASADEKLLEKKITTNEENSAAALKLKAHYTGKDVEKDGLVLTTTGFDTKTVRKFLKALRLLVRNA